MEKISVRTETKGKFTSSSQLGDCWLEGKNNILKKVICLLVLARNAVAVSHDNNQAKVEKQPFLKGN